MAALVSSAAGGHAVKAPDGKALFRKYCGQCHALLAALAVGSGGDKSLGIDGGPSFNDLRVPFTLSVVAVNETFAGHELVQKKITPSEIDAVAKFIATATKSHPYLARASDG